MKMHIDRVCVGGFYVCEKKGLVREITGETADGMVHWRSYWLADGRSTGDSLMCSKDHLMHWADREATKEEEARFHRVGHDHKEMAAMVMTNSVVACMSDEQLIAEVCRRGYRVVRADQ
jgi:hypothetical protein